MRGIRSLLATAVVFGGVGVALAAPASAGCETQTFAQYCDGPVQQDGTFTRCQVAFGTTNAFGATVVPSTSRCYPVDPAQPWPMFPLGQPQHHIYP